MESTLRGGESPSDAKANIAEKPWQNKSSITPSDDNRNEIEHRFSFLASLGLAYAILNSWVAMAASLSIVLPSGGPVAMIWGLCISGIGVMCVAASLAEICSVLPTSGGPYHWTYALSPPSYRRGFSYSIGWMACAGWVALTATTSSLGASFITGIISLLHDNYEVKSWHTFILFVAFAVGGWLVNVFGIRLLGPINEAALWWSLSGAVIIIITCLACASPTYSSGSFVFGSLINNTGWPNGVAFILGLLQSTFGLVGVDGVSHMVDEMPDPHKNAPRAMLLAPLIGALSSLIVLIVFLFVLTDIDEASTSASGALLTIIYQAVSNRGGAVALLIFPVTSMAFAAISILCACSRQIHAFAKDDGLPFSKLFARQMGTQQVPIPAITFTSAWVIIFGLVYLGSSSALNAILSSSVVFLQLSYLAPITLLLMRGRSHLDVIFATSFSSAASLPAGEIPSNPTARRAAGHFVLPRTLGLIINVWSVIFGFFTSIFFLFPPDLPTTGPGMNYAVVVLAVAAIIAAGTWIFQARKGFEGPRDLEVMLQKAREARTDGLQAGENVEEHNVQAKTE